MPQPAVSPITLSIDVRKLQDLVQSAQKSTQPQQVNIDIYLAPAEARPGSEPVSMPQGPHEVSRGAWAILPHSDKQRHAALYPAIPPPAPEGE